MFECEFGSTFNVGTAGFRNSHQYVLCSTPGCLFESSLSPLSSALFAPRMFAARPGQKSPTAQHEDSSADKEKDDGANYTTVDWREFMCNTWHLEPTLRSAVHHDCDRVKSNHEKKSY